MITIGVSRDSGQYVLWHHGNIDLPNSTLIVIPECLAHNMNVDILSRIGNEI